MKEVDPIERMAQLVSLRAKRKLGTKATLRVVSSGNLHRELPGAPRPAAARAMDEITRESYCRLIRSYRRSWGAPMQLLIEQACVGLQGIEQLGDDDLKRLLRDMQRGLDCIRDDVSFEDAGLLREIR